MTHNLQPVFGFWARKNFTAFLVLFYAFSYFWILFCRRKHLDWCCGYHTLQINRFDESLGAILNQMARIVLPCGYSSTFLPTFHLKNASIGDISPSLLIKGFVRGSMKRSGSVSPSTVLASKLVHWPECTMLIGSIRPVWRFAFSFRFLAYLYLIWSAFTSRFFIICAIASLLAVVVLNSTSCPIICSTSIEVTNSSSARLISLTCSWLGVFNAISWKCFSSLLSHWTSHRCPVPSSMLRLFQLCWDGTPLRLGPFPNTCLCSSHHAWSNVRRFSSLGAVTVDDIADWTLWDSLNF